MATNENFQSDFLNKRPLVKKLWKLLERVQQSILVLCSVFLVLGVSIQVFLRYVLKSDLLGIQELIIILAFWLYFIGSSLGSLYNKHISAELVSIYVSNKKIKQFI